MQFHQLNDSEYREWSWRVPWSKKWPMVWVMVIHPVMEIHPHQSLSEWIDDDCSPIWVCVYMCIYLSKRLSLVSSYDPTFHHGIMGSGKVTCPKETWNGSKKNEVLWNVISFGQFWWVGPFPEEMVITCHDFVHEISPYFIYPTL